MTTSSGSTPAPPNPAAASPLGRLDAPLAARLEGLAWQLLRGRLRGRMHVVGVCGAQGSGKSTLAAALCTLWQSRGLRCAVLSLDDLYLTRAQREQLARTQHPLLRTRGVPGTHDVALGHAVFDSLARAGRTRLPRFDKSRDTRRPLTDWDAVDGPLDVLLFEGWCVGARPQTEAALREPLNTLEREHDHDGRWRRAANMQLAGPYQTMFARLDTLLLLAAPSFDVVLGWRREQERALARLSPRGSAVLDDAALARFVQHFERLTRHVLAEMPGRADLTLRLDSARRPR